MRRIGAALLLLCCLTGGLSASALAAAKKPPSSGNDRRVELVFGTPDAPRALRLGAEGMGNGEEIPLPERTPLGSLWKLFVYAYLIDSTLQPADYQCTGKDRSEESYCCRPGERIGRDAALAQSCGLYFRPQRLGIHEAEWRNYWSQRAAQVPDWLLNLDAMQPATEVSVHSLLTALASFDDSTRARTMRALQKVTLEPRARPLLTLLGSQLRVKTWSWKDEQDRRIGGFAGWLADGRPLWLRGSGTSAPVIQRSAPWLSSVLPQTAPIDEACVRVRFFARYPLRSVLQDGEPATPGLLKGRVSVQFANGQKLEIPGARGLTLRQSGAQPVVEGRFGLNDYVARVLQREGAANPPAAARALAVAARTYLVHHAGFGKGCYEIADDSHAQRVSPAPPVAAARAAADWSDGLILAGASGRYHSRREGPQQMAWTSAVRWADEGADWTDILQRAYGGGGFALIGDADGGECKVLTEAESWLATRQATWKAHLESQPGFEPPSPEPRVCQLDHGNPYADIGRNRIYATGAGTPNERLTLTHEYLHFALANHPSGRDEDLVEHTARKLLGLP